MSTSCLRPESALRVLWLGDTRDEPPPNGACVWAGNALVELSTHAKVCVCAPTCNPSSVCLDNRGAKNISLHVRGDRLSPLELQAYNRSLRALLTTSPELLDIDVVYDACGYLYTGHFLEWLRGQCKAPIVQHCMIAFSQHSTMAEYPESWRRWLVSSQGRAFRTVDRLLCLSRSDYQRIVASDALLVAKTSVSPLGTPIPDGSGSQWEPFGGVFTVTFAGRSNDVSKGFDVFSAAAEEILRSVENCRICVAGPRALDLMDPRVNYCGWLSPREIWNLLLDTHFFVMPSRDEALGLAAIEAMSHGAIVIAAPRGGLLDIIEHGRNGILLSGQVEGWASEIARMITVLATDLPLCRGIGQNAHESAATRWSLAHSVNSVSASWIDVTRKESS